jgi:hypothetical protein
MFRMRQSQVLHQVLVSGQFLDYVQRRLGSYNSRTSILVNVHVLINPSVERPKLERLITDLSPTQFRLSRLQSYQARRIDRFHLRYRQTCRCCDDPISANLRSSLQRGPAWLSLDRQPILVSTCIIHLHKSWTERKDLPSCLLLVGSQRK